MSVLIPALVTVIIPFGMYGAWDSWCRYLRHKEQVAALRNDRQDRLILELQVLRALFQQNAELVESSVEKNRAVLKGFIDSMTDIVKISEEDKQQLQNRLVASKLGKK